MSRTPPARRRPSAQVSGTTVRAVAYVAAPGDEVTDESRSEEWEVVSVRQSAGGQVATAELFRKLDVSGRMRNRTISELAPQKVEVWTLNAKGENDQPLFWGEMDTRSMRLSPGGEGETATATVRDYHFGEPLRGMQVWDNADAGDTLIVEHDAEFNPLVDGRVIDNMMRQQANDAFPEYNIWFLPESTRTETAYENHGDLVSPYPWDVKSIFKTLQGWLNIDESHVTNYVPSDDDFADAPSVKNVTLRRGQYLPQLLDALLPPFGYQWYLGFKADSGRITPRITIYQRGKGAEKKLTVPKLDEHATLQHNADSIDLSIDVGSVANQVRCDGGVKQYQVTLTLHRAWSEDDDDADIADLTKDDDGASGALAHGPVWRKWVANEAGDYTGTRTEITDVVNFDSVFGSGNWVVRRRFMENCLTWEDTEHTRRMPVRIEYSDIGNSNGAFTPIDPGWGARVLQDEIGVMFTANTPPEVLVAAGANAYVRITGTISGDQRLTYTADRQDDHPNPHTSEVVLDVSDQFHYRQVVDSPTTHYSRVTGDADEVDDTTALQSFAETVRDQKEPLMVQASVGLFGVHLEYQIGDIIAEVDGRSIKLNRLPAARGERYLQVVGREWNFPGQRTTLFVMPYDR